MQPSADGGFLSWPHGQMGGQLIAAPGVGPAWLGKAGASLSPYPMDTAWGLPVWPVHMSKAALPAPAPGGACQSATPGAPPLMHSIGRLRLPQTWSVVLT